MEANYLEAVKGDQSQFSHLYQAYYPILYRYGKSLTYDEELVIDGIQELFLYLWEKQDLLSGVSHMKGYLLRAFRRRIFKKINKVRAHEHHMQELAIESKGNWEDKASGEFLLIEAEKESEFENSIQSFLSSLSPRRREVVMLRYYEGLNHQEIADYLGLRYQTVLNHFQAAFN